MNIFSALSFFTAFVLFLIGFVSLLADFRSKVNRIFSLLMFTLGIWAFFYAFVYCASTKEKAWIYYKISSYGWIFFAAIGLHFAILLSYKGRYGKSPAIKLIYLPPSIFLFKNFFGSITTDDFFLTTLGWVEIPLSQSPWYHLFFFYYSSYVVAAIYLFWQWRKKALSKTEKKQANLIFFTTLLTFLLGSLVNTILPFLGVRVLPAIAPIFTLLFAAGIGTAMLKYRLLRISPFLATDEVLTMMKDYFVLLDSHWRIVDINRQVEETLKFEKNSVFGKFIDSIVHPDHIEILKNLSPSGQKEIEFLTKDGEYIPVLASLSSIKDKFGDKIGYAIVAQDLREKRQLEEEIKIRQRVEEALLSQQNSLERIVKERTADLIMINETLRREIEERKKVEEELKESEEKYRLLFENAGDAICTLNEKLEVTGLNKKAEELFGYGKEEIIGKNIFDINLIDENDRERVKKSLLFSLETKKETKGGIRLIRKDGQRRICEVTSTVYIDRKRNAPIILSLIRDVTRRKKMEEELFFSRKMEATGILARGIAHDFNNLLAVVLGNISLAKMSLDPHGNPHKKLIDAESAVFRAKELVKKLLRFAETKEGQKKEIDLKSILEDTAKFVFGGSSVRCEFEFLADVPLIYGDENHIRELMSNVMINAKEAMMGKGVLKVKGEVVKMPPKNEFGLEEEDYVKITLSDTGCGIREEILPHIFDPYFSTKEMGATKGVGFGLALAYSIVKNHRGHIEVDSKLGAGTVVTIYLPAKRSKK